MKEMKTACKIRKNPKILSDYFEFFRLERFPKVDWMILYEDPGKYATRIEEAHPRKIQQCECCGNAIPGKAWALKTGGKHYYRYYSYLCERCYNNAPKIIAIWKEMGEPHYPTVFSSQDTMDRFKRFRTRLSEEGLVEFATPKGLLRLCRSPQRELVRS